MVHTIVRAAIASSCFIGAAVSFTAPAGALDDPPVIEIQGEPVPLDGRPLPENLTEAERRAVFEAAIEAQNEAAIARLPEGEGPTWLPLEGTVELWCTQSNGGYSGCAGHHDRPALDIGVPVGTPVYASGPGIVSTADTAGGGRGTYVDLVHPDGSSSHYFHLSELAVGFGQVVDRGELIGLSGSTGSSSAPHLHYEEHGFDGQPRPIGPMLGRVGSEIVSYPVGPFGLDWPDVPYGTMLTNDGYRRPAPTDLNGDGRPDTASADLAGFLPSLGVSGRV